MERLEVASPSSPIAVFKACTVLDSKFARTVLTQRRIKEGAPDLIGVYDNRATREQVEADINRARIIGRMSYTR